MHKRRNWKHEVCFFIYRWMCGERDVHLQVKDNRARTGERFVAAGDALHPDGECAISGPTGILKWKKIHITEGKKTKNHF